MASYTITTSGSTLNLGVAATVKPRVGLNEYASLSQLRRYLSLASADTSDNAQLQDFLQLSSRAIDRYTRRKFYPYASTLKFDLPSNHDMLKFGRDDILEVQGLSHLNGASEIDSSVYNLKCGDTYNLTPYDRLVIRDSSGSLMNFSGTEQQAIHVDAVLGFHEDYGNAWVNSGGSLISALGASVTTASVSGSAGMNVEGAFPRFDTGQIWRLSGGTAQEEFVCVLDTQPFSGTGGSYINLIRGVNGTTTASHAASGTIEVFQPEADVRFCARRLSAYIYEQARSPFTNTIAVPSMDIIEMPSAWPVDVKEKLDRLQKRKLYSARF